MNKGSFGEPWEFEFGHEDEAVGTISDAFGTEVTWTMLIEAGPRAVECVNALAGINNPVDAVERMKASLNRAQNVIDGFQGDFCREHCSRLKNDHFEECSEATEALSGIRAALAALGDGQ